MAILPGENYRLFDILAMSPAELARFKDPTTRLCLNSATVDELEIV